MAVAKMRYGCWKTLSYSIPFPGRVRFHSVQGQQESLPDAAKVHEGDGQRFYRTWLIERIISGKSSSAKAEKKPVPAGLKLMDAWAMEDFFKTYGP